MAIALPQSGNKGSFYFNFKTDIALTGRQIVPELDGGNKCHTMNKRLAEAEW